jgi:hypothetical protein
MSDFLVNLASRAAGLMPAVEEPEITPRLDTSRSMIDAPISEAMPESPVISVAPASAPPLIQRFEAPPVSVPATAEHAISRVPRQREQAVSVPQTPPPQTRNEAKVGEVGGQKLWTPLVEPPKARVADYPDISAEKPPQVTRARDPLPAARDPQLLPKRLPEAIRAPVGSLTADVNAVQLPPPTVELLPANTRPLGPVLIPSPPARRAGGEKAQTAPRSADTEPVHIRIGTVEIRGPVPDAPAQPAGPKAIGFADYLAMRTYRKWSR